MAVLAYFEQSRPAAERRGSPRKVLNLDTEATSLANEGGAVIIHNLSPEGLLIESDAQLTIGAEFDLRLPEAGLERATVMWSQGRFFGCAFSRPLSTAAQSAALLKSWAPVAADAHVGEAGSSHDRDPMQLPLGARLWIIIALAVAAWAMVATLLFFL